MRGLESAAVMEGQNIGFVWMVQLRGQRRGQRFFGGKKAAGSAVSALISWMPRWLGSVWSYSYLEVQEGSEDVVARLY